MKKYLLILTMVFGGLFFVKAQEGDECVQTLRHCMLLM